MEGWTRKASPPSPLPVLLLDQRVMGEGRRVAHRGGELGFLEGSYIDVLGVEEVRELVRELVLNPVSVELQSSPGLCRCCVGIPVQPL